MATLRPVFHDIAEAIRSKGISGTFKPIEMAQKIGEIRSLDGYGYLTFTAEEATTLTLLKNPTSSTTYYNLLKSTDGVNWTKWENHDTNGIVLNAGESVYLKAYEETDGGTAGSAIFYKYFSSSGKIKCDGDIRSIVRLIIPFDYRHWFSRLFYKCAKLTKGPELPATSTTPYCYYYMFHGCTSLTQAPELPATYTSTNCYQQMFKDCASLKTAPELPATDVASNCYSGMFQNCTSLTKAPSVLKAPELISDCYAYMFSGCTSLKTAPEIQATTVYNSCCRYMFDGCTSLTKAPSVLLATKMEQNCYSYMFRNCTSLEIGPELRGTTMSDQCYSNMFYGCTSLKRIKMNASSGQWGNYMFNGCTSLELVDMTGSTGVPHLAYNANFSNTNSTYKVVVPDSLYDTWINATNWVSIASHIMKKSDWNAAHPDDQL